MKKLTTTFALVISFISLNAQKDIYEAIPILHDTAFQWTAESDKVINLTPKEQSYSLKKWYLDKIRKEGVTAYTMNSDRKTVSSYQLSIPSLETQDWLKGLTIELPSNKNIKEWYFVDPAKPKNDYERFKYRTGIQKFSADSCCGCDEADAFLAKQVLNYKHGKFSIYNVFISPLCARQPGKVPLEWYPLGHVAYNNKADRKLPAPGKDVVFLNTDVVEYDFSREYPSPFDSVITVYQTDIGSLIYQDILKGNLKPVEIQTGEIIQIKDFLSLNMRSDTIPVFNDDGEYKIDAYKVLHQERSPSDFSRLRITQDLYFDFKNERLYSVVRSVVIVMAVRFDDGTLRGTFSFCRLE